MTTGHRGALGAPGRAARRRRVAAVALLLLVPVAAATAGWAKAARAGSAQAAAAGQVTLSPTTGVPGTVVQVAGTGFEPGARLLLRWDHGIGQATVTVAGDGTFQAALLVFRKDVVGPRRLLVEPAGQAAVATATTEPTGTAQAPTGSTTTTEATATTQAAAVAADATTFVVLPTRQNPALGGAATQGR